MGALKNDVAFTKQSNNNFIRRTAVATDLLVAAPTNVNVFAVRGGPIQVISFFGIITQLFDAGVTTIQIQHIPTGGAAAPMATASGPLNAQAVNIILSITGAVGVGLAIGAAAGVGVTELTNKLVLVPGNIIITVAAAAQGVGGGRVDWYLKWAGITEQSNVGIL
ncbi:MAG: hypothetical protein ACYDHZ_00680 [Dehalococcoidia bacterium]